MSGSAGNGAEGTDSGEWLTGGTVGINNIARPSVLGFSLDGALAYY